MIKDKAIYFLFLEGDYNATEKNYFKNFQNRKNDYTLKFIPTHNSEPESMMKYAKKRLAANGYNKDNDQVFLLVDVDNDTKRNEIIRKNLQVKAKKNKYKYIFSNPCFELRFLNHFKFTLKQYSNQDELIADLKKYIPNYSKNLEVFGLLIDEIKVAIVNSKNQLKNKNSDVPATPGTLVFELISLLHYLK